MELLLSELPGCPARANSKSNPIQRGFGRPTGPLVLGKCLP